MEINVEERPGISVIVPVYNLENKVARCIWSILKQSYDSFELILINDGSVDDSFSILKSFERNDERVKVIDQINQGVEKARLKGLELAIGQYVIFVDGDDFLPLDSFKLLYDSAQLHQADVVIGNNMRVLDRWGIIRKKIKSKFLSAQVVEKDEYMNEYYISFFGLHRYRAASLWANIYRKELFLDLPQPCGLKVGEDEYLNMHIMLRAKRVCFIPNNVYYYRFGGITTSINPNQVFDIYSLYHFKKKKVEEFSVRDGEKYLVIELLNSVNGYFKRLVACGIYSKKQVVAMIKKNVESAEYQDSMMLLNKLGSTKIKSDFLVLKASEKRYEEMYDWIYTEVGKKKMIFKLKCILAKLLT